MEEGPLAGAGVSAGAGGPAGAMDGGGLRLGGGGIPQWFRFQEWRDVHLMMMA